MVPAYLVFVILLLGIRVRLRTVAWCVAGFVLAVVGFAALDLSRAADQRTHLGRLIERIDERGIGDFVVVVQRKLSDNLGSVRTSSWGLLLLIFVVLLVWLRRRAPERLSALSERFPEWRPTWISFTVLAFLGYACNDSGIAVPGVMLAILVPALVYLLVWTSDGDATPPVPAPTTARVSA
jgi:ascorbate-specific PTS system EIIC-type component UlaA